MSTYIIGLELTCGPIGQPCQKKTRGWTDFPFGAGMTFSHFLSKRYIKVRIRNIREPAIRNEHVHYRARTDLWTNRTTMSKED
jgi:hypothetical protein